MVTANRRLAGVLLFLACWAFTCAPVVAADLMVVDAQGTALKLAGDKWEEIADGETVPDGGVFRTLRSGRILLGVDGSFIRLAGDTAVQVILTRDGSAMVVHLYAGSVDVEAHIGGSRISVATPVMTASAQRADYSVSVGDQLATVRAISGVVVVSDVLRNRSTAIEAGHEVTASLLGAGSASTTGSASSEKPAVPGSAQTGALNSASEDAPGQGEPVGHGGPPGGSPGGGNPNGGSGRSDSNNYGASGGNGNGADNSNGGAGGKSNAGGNGNAESKGGGNGNGNGADNGNGGAGGKSRAGGNGNAAENKGGGNGNGN